MINFCTPPKHKGIILGLRVSHPITNGCTISALAGIKPMTNIYIVLKFYTVFFSLNLYTL